MDKPQRIARARMALTGESYTTALARLRECGRIEGTDEGEIARKSIAQNPPRLGTSIRRTDNLTLSSPSAFSNSNDDDDDDEGGFGSDSGSGSFSGGDFGGGGGGGDSG